MKIGFVSKFPEQEDGIAIYSASLCNELENLGIGVVRIGDKSSTKANYKVDFNSLFLGSQLKGIAEAERLDLLHIQYVADHFGKFRKIGALNILTKFFYSLRLAGALKQGVPTIVTLHEVHSEFGTLRGKAFNFLQKKIIGKTNAAIAHTRQQKEFIQLKYKKKLAFHIPHGLAAREMHKPNGKNLLFFGMLNYGKGVEYAIRAMNFLPDFNLVVAGKAISKAYEKLVRETAAENKLGNVRLDIRWVPEEEKWKIIESSDIMVFPYVWAPYQSGSMHNAFSCGIPVVVTEAGAISEVVKEYICGRVVEQRSPKAIAAGIRAVYGNYETYQHGVNKYRHDANWEMVAEKHGEAYNQTIQEYYESHGIIEKEKKEKEKMAGEMAKEESEIHDA